MPDPNHTWNEIQRDYMAEQDKSRHRTGNGFEEWKVPSFFKWPVIMQYHAHSICCVWITTASSDSSKVAYRDMSWNPWNLSFRYILFHEKSFSDTSRTCILPNMIRVVPVVIVHKKKKEVLMWWYFWNNWYDISKLPLPVAAEIGVKNLILVTWSWFIYNCGKFLLTERVMIKGYYILSLMSL